MLGCLFIFCWIIGVWFEDYESAMEVQLGNLAAGAAAYAEAKVSNQLQQQLLSVSALEVLHNFGCASVTMGSGSHALLQQRHQSASNLLLLLKAFPTNTGPQSLFLANEDGSYLSASRMGSSSEDAAVRRYQVHAIDSLSDNVSCSRNFPSVQTLFWK